MSVLRDLAIDVINTAKSSKDARQKVFQLGQLREIVLHRDKSLLPDFIEEIFTFIVDKSAQLRKFLVSFAGDLLEQDFPLSLPHMLTMGVFFLTESNDSVIVALAEVIAKFYARIVLAIVRMPSAPSGLDPKAMWEQFRLILSKLNEFISSGRSDNLRRACLKVMEEQVLFGTPMTGATASMDPRLSRKVDPRLARTADAASSSSSSQGVEQIPLHHAHISRTLLTQEAEDTFNKLCMYVYKGGPQASLFSPSLMSRLVQVVCSLGVLRPSVLGARACKASAHLLAAGPASATLADMAAADKEHVLRAAHRLVRAGVVYVGADAAIAAVEGAGDAPAEGLAGSKRSRPEDFDASQASSLGGQAADDALSAEEMRQMQEAIDLTSEAGVPQGEFLDLSSSILPIHSLQLTAAAGRYVQVDQAAGGCAPLGVGVAQLQESSMLALLVLLQHFLDVHDQGGKMFRGYLKLVARTVRSLVESHVTEGLERIRVQLVQQWSADMTSAEQKSLQAFASLPSFLLTLMASPDTLSDLRNRNNASDLSPAHTLAGPSLQLLAAVAESVYARSPASREAYADFACAAACRLLQHAELRAAA
eukprot:gene30618-36994_t